MTTKKSQEHSLRISPPQKATTGLSFVELGLLTHMLQNVNADGLFQQYDGKIADQFATTRPTVHRIRKSLIHKGAVEVIKESYRGSDGWLIPPVLRPLEPSQLMDKGVFPSQLMDKESQSRQKRNGLGDVIENTKPILVHENTNPSPNGQQKHSTVNSSLSELSMGDQHGSRAGRTVVPSPPVDKAPVNDDVLADWRAGRKAKAEAIRKRNAQ